MRGWWVVEAQGLPLAEVSRTRGHRNPKPSGLGPGRCLVIRASSDDIQRPEGWSPPSGLGPEGR